MGLHKRSKAIAWSFAAGVYGAAASLGKWPFRYRQASPVAAAASSSSSPTPPAAAASGEGEPDRSPFAAVVDEGRGSLTLSLKDDAAGPIPLVVEEAAMTPAGHEGTPVPMGAGLVRIEAHRGTVIELSLPARGTEVQRVCLSLERPAWILAHGALLACAGSAEVTRAVGDADTVVRLADGAEEATMWLASRGKAEVAPFRPGHEQVPPRPGAMLAEQLSPWPPVPGEGAKAYLSYVQSPPPPNGPLMGSVYEVDAGLDAVMEGAVEASSSVACAPTTPTPPSPAVAAASAARGRPRSGRMKKRQQQIVHSRM